MIQRQPTARKRVNGQVLYPLDVIVDGRWATWGVAVVARIECVGYAGSLALVDRLRECLL